MKHRHAFYVRSQNVYQEFNGRKWVSVSATDYKCSCGFRKWSKEYLK